MAYQAKLVSTDSIGYFRQDGDEGPFMRVGDVILRANQDPKEVFSRLIRLATNSHWSHCAVLYMLNDPYLGFDKTFLVEAMTTGAHVTSWEKEVQPPERFTVGIKRVALDWYAESPAKQARRDGHYRDDVHGIGYLRHVRGMALDQIDALYDHEVVNELTALYMERVFKRHLGSLPIFAQVAAFFAEHFRKKDDKQAANEHILRFICSGLVQYSFFEALRVDISNDLAQPESRDAGLSNLQNLHRVIFCPDPDSVINEYIHNVQNGIYDIHKSAPDSVLDLLKTATPADFNNSAHLQWDYIIRRGVVWHITSAQDGYVPQSEDEQAVLTLMEPEHQGE